MSDYIERYWRDATPQDAIKDPPMVARFRDSLDCNSCMSVWSEPQRLLGWDRSNDLNWSGGVCYWRFCQVYDAPDPGEGWRLIDASSETKQLNDEYLSYDGSWYRGGACFEKNLTYRRRITPTVTHIPFTWEDREQLRGRWVYRDKQELQLVNFDNSDGFHASGVHVENLCKYWKFCDTKKPVGKEVTQ